jgi:hypothetical protein
MASNEEIFEAVASIESPMLPGRTLGELGLVKSAERRLAGKVKVDLLPPTLIPRRSSTTGSSMRSSPTVGVPTSRSR